MTRTEARYDVDQSVDPARDAFVAGRDLYIGLDGVGQDADVPTLSTAHTDHYVRHRPIFVQYLNPEILACYGYDIVAADNRSLLTRALQATRLAVLATNDCLILPASYFFEIPHFDVFLNQIDDLLIAGQICYTASLSDLTIYEEAKADEYRDDPHNRYRLDHSLVLRRGESLAWRPRRGRSTAIDIGAGWRSAIMPDGDLGSLLRSTRPRQGHRPGRAIERALITIPDRLEGRAFIGRFVRPAIPFGLTRQNSAHMDLFLSRAYLGSYLSDLDAMMLVDFRFGDLSCGVSSILSEPSVRLLSARRLELVLRWLSVDVFIREIATWADLLELRSAPEFDVVALEALGRTSTARLSKSISRARRLAELTAAHSLGQAKRNVEVVANELLRMTS
jgi:hypothetical protein